MKKLISESSELTHGGDCHFIFRSKKSKSKRYVKIYAFYYTVRDHFYLLRLNKFH